MEKRFHLGPFALKLANGEHPGALETGWIAKAEGPQRSSHCARGGHDAMTSLVHSASDGLVIMVLLLEHLIL